MDIKTVDVATFDKLLAQEKFNQRLAVVENGRTLGYWIPVTSLKKPKRVVKARSTVDWEAFKKSTEKLHDLLKAQGIDPEDLLRDFEELRKERWKSQRK
jgi:hypothetical protein